MKRIVLAALSVGIVIGPAFADTTWVEVGSPYRQNAIPFWGQSYDAFRVQLLYLQNEIGQAGRIVAFGLNSTSDQPSEFYKVRVLLCHTALSQLTAVFEDNYGGNVPVTILEAETLLVGTGQNGTWFYLGGGFDYNNTDNLLLEIVWHGDAGRTVTFWRNPNGTLRRCFAPSDTAKTGTVDDVNGYFARIGFVPVGIEAPFPAEARAGGLRVLPSFGRPPFRFLYAGKGTGSVQVFTPAGRMIAELPLVNGQAVWDMPKVSAGVYFCRVGSESVAVSVVR